jgi:hypothetical protein
LSGIIPVAILPAPAGNEEDTKAGSADNFEKSYPQKLNREDPEDREENIYVNFIGIV